MRPQVLIPFNIAEAATPEQAAAIAGRCPRTVRRWAELHDLGRPVGGRWLLSRVALALHLDGDRAGLAAYLRGDRNGRVAEYFQRVGLDAARPDRTIS